MDDEEEFPRSENFDTSEAIASGNVPPKGRKMILHVTDPKHLQATIMKSDAATVTIPEVQLEEAYGTGRYITVSDLLEEMNEKLRDSAGYFPPGFQRDKLFQFIDLMNLVEHFVDLNLTSTKIVRGVRPFTIIVDDPLSFSYIKKGTQGDMEIEIEDYQRTWAQDQEFGLLESAEREESTDEESLEKMAELIRGSKKIVASAEYESFIKEEKSRAEFWKMKTEFYEIVKDAKCNPSHEIFAILQKQDRLHAIITQNIDHLHEKAGVPTEKIICLHGTESFVDCLSCGKQYERREIHERIVGGESVPYCNCGGILKPGTVFFGQALVPEVLEKAKQVLEECDLLILVSQGFVLKEQMGTSLEVQPANKLPQIPLGKRVPVVIVNLDETQYDNYAAVVIHRPSGQTMKDLMTLLS